MLRFIRSISIVATQPIKNELILYTRKYCGLCDQAEESILLAIASFSKNQFTLTKIDIDAGMENKRKYLKYTYDVPVLHFAGGEIKHRVDVKALKKVMRESLDKSI
jgi:hypothetical protein